MRTFLGNGILTWNAAERRTDRYGSVFLMQDGMNSVKDGEVENRIDHVNAEAHVGDTGKLIVKILDPRQSTHIGDLFHGFMPQTPDRGEIITLGEGTLFLEDQEASGFCVGLHPKDREMSFWLNPTELYRAHEQLVELNFEAEKLD